MLPSVSKITLVYTHITELCQQVFIYNEEAHCTSHTSYAHELPQSHFGDNQAMITCVIPILLLRDLSILFIVDIYMYHGYVDIQFV